MCPDRKIEEWRARQDSNPLRLVRSQVIGAQVIEVTLLFAVTSVANCMTVQHRA
jgi:hypothetical protein